MSSPQNKKRYRLGFADQSSLVTIKLPPDEPAPWDMDDKLRVVGKAVPRIDGPAKSSGQAKYTFDINLPGLLHARVLRSPHACARVKSIDLSAAQKMPGVRATLAIAKPGDRMLFAGQDVAALAADRPEQAQAALASIVVQYEVLDHVVNLDDAMAEGAAIVHHGAVKERRTEGDEPGQAGAAKVSGNIRALPDSRAGDAKAALANAAVTHRASYSTPVILHSALESHGIVVRWDDKRSMTVWASTQSIFSARDEMAEIFSLKAADVHVITEFMGGGFGAKFGAGAPGSRLGFVAGELAKQAKAPVKLMCSRYGEQVATGNRPGSRQEVALGASKSGKLEAIHVISHGSAGIGTGAGVGRNAFGIYTRCPNRLVEAHDVFTHAGPGTAMRAPGHPQGAFAIELALDELAVKLKLDPLDLRLAHDEHPVRLHQFRVGAKAFDWKAKRAAAKRGREAGHRLRRGYGVAASIWGDFGRGKAAVASVNVHRDGSIEVRNGVQDLGTGIATVLVQVVAEVLGQPMDAIKVSYGRSEFGRSVGSGGSQTTSSVTPAVRKAAEMVKQELLELAAKKLGVKSTQLSWRPDGSVGVQDMRLAFPQICQLIHDDPLTATASRPDTYGSHPMKFVGGDSYQMAGVQFAEVEVDTWTGEVRLMRMLAVHDPGRVMNPLTLRSQINGGVIMGTGMALCEQRVIDRRTGRVLNANLEGYKIAAIADIPPIDIILTEVHTGNNNTGAVGIGEPSTIPTAAAIANAVFNAIGAPVRSLPLTPDKVLAAIDGLAKDGGAK